MAARIDINTSALSLAYKTKLSQDILSHLQSNNLLSGTKYKSSLHLRSNDLTAKKK